MRSSVLSALAVCGRFALAAIGQICPDTSSGICYSLNIPEATAKSGQGDIYFQISAPAKFEWVGLGQGTGMTGANIFVMYASANGQNVTVSPRRGLGHFEPKNDGDMAQLTLLEGSGVMNDMMVANVKCSNCNNWSGGTMDFAASSASWIYASKAGTPIMSDSIDEQIPIHDFNGANGVITWDLVSAQGGSDQNPFVVSSSGSPSVTTGGSTVKSGSPLDKYKIAHGVMAALAFVVIFPSGGIILRIGRLANAWKVHAVIQSVAYVMFVAAFGIGIWLATQLGLIGHPHPIVGIVVFTLVVLQPLTGQLHHRVFKSTSRRNIWSVFHLGMGRIAIILGMINGGLGLQLAMNASRGAIIAYGVIAGVSGVTYLGVMIYGEIHRARATPQKDLSDGRESVGAVEKPSDHV